MIQIDIDELDRQLGASLLQFDDISYIVQGIRSTGNFPLQMTEGVPYFLFPVHGQGEIIVEGTSNLLAPRIIVHGNGQGMPVLNTASDELHYYLVRYRAFQSCDESSSIAPSCFVLRVGELLTITDILHRLQLGMLESTHRNELKLKALFHTLLVEMMEGARHFAYTKGSHIAKDAIRFIQKHYMEPIKLHDLALRFDMSDKHFSYLFHKELGISPMNYLIQFRLKEAEKLLKQPHATVREVARMVGYSDPYFFSKLYKKHKGLSPNQVKRGVQL